MLKSSFNLNQPEEETEFPTCTDVIAADIVKPLQRVANGCDSI